MDVYARDAPQGVPPNVDFLCGWCAGCIETCILFPISKMTFRQQLHGLLLKDAVKQIFKEGVPNLYRGLLPPLIQRTSTRMVMFGMFDTYKRLLGCPDHPWTLCYAVSGMLAGSTEALLCPLERVQVLLQTSAHHSKFRNTVEAFRFVNGFGYWEFYRGFSLVLTRNSLSNALFFTLRDPLRNLLVTSLTSVALAEYAIVANVASAGGGEEEPIAVGSDDGQSPAASAVADSTELSAPVSSLIVHVANFVSGAVLGAGISTIFFPLNVVKHRIQSVIGPKALDAAAVFRLVWAERNRSVGELFRGVHLNYTRSLMTWGITNTVYEYLRGVFRTLSAS